jgi:hypothetical protein
LPAITARIAAACATGRRRFRLRFRPSACRRICRSPSTTIFPWTSSPPLLTRAVGSGDADLLIFSIGAFPAHGAASVAFLASAVTEPLLGYY